MTSQVILDCIKLTFKKPTLRNTYCEISTEEQSMRYLTRTPQNSEGCQHVKSLRNGYNLVKALEIHILFLITIIFATGGKVKELYGMQRWLSG